MTKCVMFDTKLAHVFVVMCLCLGETDGNQVRSTNEHAGLSHLLQPVSHFLCSPVLLAHATVPWQKQGLLVVYR